MENKKPRTTSAKKPVAKKETIVEAPVVEEPIVQAPVVETTKKTKPDWEIKDRRYYLLNGKSPVSYVIPSKHTARKPLLYFDPKTNMQREIRYASNQNSVFVDEQEGTVTLAHITFEDGVLAVEKQNQALQKLLSLYHPLKGLIYQEHDAVEVAEDNLDEFELEFEAMTAARSMDIDFAEAIMRAEIGSEVSKMSSTELKRDLFIFAKKNPSLFLELANDENVQLRNIAIRASEMGIINLSQDQRTFTWGSNGRKLMTVPFDEHPYSAMAAYFKTDEGMEVFSSIEKKLA
jgi:hypothetical protein